MIMDNTEDISPVGLTTLGQTFDRLRGQGWQPDRDVVLLKKNDQYAIIHADGRLTVVSAPPPVINVRL